MSESLVVYPNFKKWIFLEADADEVKQLQETTGLHSIICQLLVLRNIKTKADTEAFFHPSLLHLHNPFLMKDMDKAVERLHLAIQNNEKILIYGDYDVDGITSVSLLYLYFKSFYDSIGFYIPDRIKEGCGISSEGVQYAEENDYSVVIALDCGMKNHTEVNEGKSKQIDFIICEHHLPGDDLPDALAVLNPKRADCDYPFKELSGCGVGFKLIQAYTEKYNKDKDFLYSLLDFVAVSIAADNVAVNGENRILAYFGMELINKRSRVGFKAILDILGTRRELELMDLVFTVSPRLNAMGRISHASHAVDLLIETDKRKAKEKAYVLQDMNNERRELDKRATEQALDFIEKKNFEDEKAIVLFQKDWHQGVIAIVSARLADKFHRPTIIFTETDGMIVGSARSIRGFDVYSAIQSCNHLITQFGGHKYAAGLSLEKENLQAFIQAFKKYVEENLNETDLEPKIEVDAVIELTDINQDFYDMVEKMTPFGSGNHRPTFVTKEVIDTGNNGFVGKSHLKIHVKKPGQEAKYGIGFNMWDYIPYLRSIDSFDICYQLHVNNWKNKKFIEIKLKDLK
ncbi:MAG: single-stranded-DNA-specific exonuclease RecJ [Chitinophagales bacterium]|nr:single-stranded-DNA-specific exonuclease RecJ [Chitinophagales bacterium]